MLLKRNDDEIKKRIALMLNRGVVGARLVIPILGTKDFVIEKTDMVEAIFRAGRKNETKGKKQK